MALNVESGINDGLAVPAVAIFTAMVLEERRSTGGWIGFIAGQIGWGVLVGLVVGAVGITVLREAHRRSWSDGRYEQLATFVLPVTAYFVADAIQGNSFIAAFVAGLTFGSFRHAAFTSEGEPDSEAAGWVENPSPSFFAEFCEDAAQLLAVGAFFVFGNVLLGQVLDDVSFAVVACALLTLTVGRMLPVWIALIGTGLRWPTRVFLGWFGPRGLASIIFGLLLLEEFEASAEVGDDLFGVIALTVTASVVLHGASAAWGARTYGRWADRAAFSDDERKKMHLPEMKDVAVMPRWGGRD
jgi:NhaP-type Na+/H+ or K+/H+ antiporter